MEFKLNATRFLLSVQSVCQVCVCHDRQLCKNSGTVVGCGAVGLWTLVGVWNR